MDLTVSDTAFIGRKKPNLHLRRKQIKRLKLQETELMEKCKLLKADTDAIELSLAKVTPLAYDNSKTPDVTKLWSLQFDTQYNFLYGSYSDYKNSLISYSKFAVENLELLKYVKPPLLVKSPVSIFSKVGRNVIKNKFLDLFRTKTPEEKQLEAYRKEFDIKKAKQEFLGVRS